MYIYIYTYFRSLIIGGWLVDWLVGWWLMQRVDDQLLGSWC